MKMLENIDDGISTKQEFKADGNKPSLWKRSDLRFSEPAHYQSRHKQSGRQ